MDIDSENCPTLPASCSSPANVFPVMAISEEEYRYQFWPQLQQAVVQLLSVKSGEYASVSFEQVYSCVYKCVCNQFSEHLLDDLRGCIKNYLQLLIADLNEVQNADFIKRFDECLRHYTSSLQQITTVFTYLNRFHVETKLKTNLHMLLLSDFTATFVDPNVQQLVDLLWSAQLSPFTVEPSLKARIITGLYVLKPEYAHLAPHLFANYIPNVLPPMREADIPSQAQEIRSVQEKLVKEGYRRESSPLKRSLDSIEAACTAGAANNY